jgi:phosphoglycolate phosphatase
MAVLYLFDIDGTLLSAQGAGRRAFDRVMERQFGLTEASQGIAFGGKTDRWLVNAVFQARFDRPATEPEIDTFIDLYLLLLNEELTQQPLRVLPDVMECLHWLQQLPGVRLGIATGNVRGGADIKLAQAGLRSFFEFGGYGCDSPHRPTLVRCALERGRALLPAAERDQAVAIVVGDTVHDIEAARHIGAHACAVTTGGDDRETLAAADVVFDRLGELAAWHGARFDVVISSKST